MYFVIREIFFIRIKMTVFSYCFGRQILLSLVQIIIKAIQYTVLSLVCIPYWQCCNNNSGFRDLLLCYAGVI